MRVLCCHSRTRFHGTHRYTVLQLSRQEFALRSSAQFNCCAEGRCRSPVGLSRATQHEAGRGARPRSRPLVVPHRRLLVSTRTRPANPRRHRCDCWTRGPTAEAPTPSGSMHRDAPAVKARERPRQPLREVEKICIQGVHGPDLADFAKGKILILLFCSGGVHKVVRSRSVDDRLR